MEIGLTAGYSYYIGDINPYTHFGPRKKLAYGGLYRINLTKRHVIRFQGLRVNVEAFDSDNSNPNLVNRNLNFRNKMTELSMLLEINFHPYGLGEIGEGFTPYVFGGLAYFTMNPETQVNGNYVELIPLATEGQGSEDGPAAYKRGQMAIPFGVGIKTGLGKRLAFNLEWGIRRTWTDYIDDVSGVYADPDVVRDISGDLGRELADRTIVPIGFNGDNTGMARGNPENRDWYFYSGVILSYRLGKNDKGCWEGGR
jgi:hypothetical protein